MFSFRKRGAPWNPIMSIRLIYLSWFSGIWVRLVTNSGYEQQYYFSGMIINICHEYWALLFACVIYTIIAREWRAFLALKDYLNKWIKNREASILWSVISALSRSYPTGHRFFILPKSFNMHPNLNPYFDSSFIILLFILVMSLHPFSSILLRTTAAKKTQNTLH